MRPAALIGVLPIAAVLVGDHAVPRLSEAESPGVGVDTSAFLRGALPLGNLGGITPNARRYAISPDWKTLAAPLDSGSVLLFDIATAEPRPPLEGGFKVGTFTYSAAGDAVPYSFGLSADGRFVHWVWGKKVAAWDASSGELLLKQEIEGLEGRVHVSRDGRWLAWRAAGGDTAWSLERRAALAAPEVDAAPAVDPPDTAGNPVHSADGRFTAWVNPYLDVEVRDEESPGRPVRVLPDREKGNRGRCTLWDAQTTRGGPQLLLSHDGRVLADSCRVTDIWDLSQPVPMLVVRTGLLRQEAGRPVLSRDGRTLAYSWGGGSRLLGGEGGFGLVDVPSARPVGPPIAVKYLGAMEFSPDGAWLATVGFVPRAGVKTRFEVQIWDVSAIRAAATGAR